MAVTVNNPHPSNARELDSEQAKAIIPILYNAVNGFDLWMSPGQQLAGIANYVWNTSTLVWDKETQPSGGGGGGGAVTIADGADIAEGATTDAAVTTDTSGTVSGKLRGLVKWAYERMPTSLGQKVMAASLPVVISSDQSAIPVTGPQTDAQQRAALTANAPAATSVGVASAAALAANANRKGLILVNTSAATISLGVGVAAVLNSGITLKPNGSFNMDQFNLFTGAINAIASAAASNLAIQEFQ